METSTKIDLETVAKILELPANKVSSAVKLLEAGNTIPFITRYRKDETGGLGERQLRDIKQEVARQTALAERKAFILKSIENQGKLTDRLQQQIDSANQSRQIEDLYRPFKPRKTSLAETARQQGLEPLARDILEGHQPDTDLASRAIDFVRVDKGLTSVDEVIRGVKHILAERFSEHLQLRSRLRNLIWQSGTIKTELAAGPDANTDGNRAATRLPTGPGNRPPSNVDERPKETANHAATSSQSDSQPVAVASPAADAPASPTSADVTPVVKRETLAAASGSDATGISQSSGEALESAQAGASAASDNTADIDPLTNEGVTPGNAVESPNASVPADTGADHSQGLPETQGPASAEVTAKPPGTTQLPSGDAAGNPADKPKKKRKKKKKKSRPDPFAEFAAFEESLQKIPPHRVLAINRGERAGKLKVRIGCDTKQLGEIARAELIAADHPFGEFLSTVCDETLNRLLVPSIEREVRRELTERSETHAVNVFARNLRHLFLQPPMRGYRVMGIDPGYRSGCKVAVIDETGQPLGHGVFSIVGNQERIKSNQQRLIDLIRQHNPHLIAIGNGSGCRTVEQFVSDVISGELADRDLQYTIVNQAGTSTYSTSELGQFELPEHDPVIRSAISIARRLQDPLSELVKVNPANVGVGLYQHDIKAKHLAESLEQVVESCVNYVGVNANTASPSLLQYVSGLGQTTARKLVEHRNEKGPFREREQLKEVSGFGDVTFVQSAGFLRIDHSPNALDQTSIHPEDYQLANRVLSKLGGTIEELIPPPKPVRRPAPKPLASDVSSGETVAENPQPVTETKATALETTPTETALPELGTAATLPTDELGPETENSGATTETEDRGDDKAGAGAMASPASPDRAVADSDVTGQQPAPGPEDTIPATPPLSPAIRAEKQKRRKELVQKIKALETHSLAAELGVGEMKLRDLMRALRNPVQDPREDLPAPVFRKGILKFDDLKQGMQLRGQIVNVVDFGVFLNIGIGESCLVHISRLANRYVRDPHWFYSVGDVMNVWVQDVDPAKRRVTLTAIRPDGGKRDPSRSQGESSHGGRPTRSDRGRGRSAGQAGGRGKKSHTTGRGKPHGKPHSKSHSKSHSKPHSKRPPRKPKPVTPITDGMVEGKEPMRSFSDLLQFHKRKADEDPQDKS